MSKNTKITLIVIVASLIVAISFALIMNNKKEEPKKDVEDTVMIGDKNLSEVVEETNEEPKEDDKPKYHITNEGVLVFDEPLTPEEDSEENVEEDVDNSTNDDKKTSKEDVTIESNENAFTDEEIKEITGKSKDKTIGDRQRKTRSGDINKEVKINESIVSTIEETAGISETDLYFLQDIVNITDEIVADYTDTLSYALSGEFDSGVANIEYLRKDLTKLKDLEVEDATLKKVKENLIKGTECYISGFEEYFDYDKSANDTFKEADKYLYTAQEFLKTFLESKRTN